MSNESADDILKRLGARTKVPREERRGRGRTSSPLWTRFGIWAGLVALSSGPSESVTDVNTFYANKEIVNKFHGAMWNMLVNSAAVGYSDSLNHEASQHEFAATQCEGYQVAELVQRVAVLARCGGWRVAVFSPPLAPPGPGGASASTASPTPPAVGRLNLVTPPATKLPDATGPTLKLESPPAWGGKVEEGPGSETAETPATARATSGTTMTKSRPAAASVVTSTSRSISPT